MAANSEKVFAFRRLNLLVPGQTENRIVLATVFQPQLLKIYDDDPQNVDWQVDIQLTGIPALESVWRSRAIQIDELGAMIQALQLLAAYVRSRDEYKEGRLFWLEKGDNCGMPMFEEPEYQAKK